MSTHTEGIINPPIDALLKKSDSKYGLVIFGARRARQINAYYSQLHEGLFEYVGPLVDTQLNEKPLSIAFREIDEGLIEGRPVEHAGFAENGQLTTEADLAADVFGADFFAQGTEESAVDFSADAAFSGGTSVDFSSGDDSPAEPLGDLPGSGAAIAADNASDGAADAADAAPEEPGREPGDLQDL
ncbi:DNA-directed RNA polymerase subunit omega [Kocuria rosea]|uniref:DNA-directed RNA polymerase subunit omega n=1 Tax=Kocuria rosea TaxID=1275 RepID=UPI000F713D87|nr:DNA-directed RNA polymerase subunit omega [Kocuria rosea]VEH43144.1 DNA-directed RNA polymerase subunit omega [Kocuria rosea]